MELVGRLTADAIVKELPDGRKVVQFSIAINNSYRTKESQEVKEQTTFVNCSYWQATGVAPYLTKGRQVELFGTIGVNAYTNGAGEARANLTFHVNNIKLGDRPKGNGTSEAAAESEAPLTKVETRVTAEDLPF